MTAFFSAFAPATWRAAQIGRWVALVLGSLLFLGFLAFFFGEGPPHFARLTAQERWLFVGFGGLFGGLALAWFREGWGGLLSLAGWALFFFLDRRGSLTVPFLLPATVGLLHLVCWWRLGRPRGL